MKTTTACGSRHNRLVTILLALRALLTANLISAQPLTAPTLVHGSAARDAPLALAGIVSIGDLVKRLLDDKELEASVLLDLSRMHVGCTMRLEQKMRNSEAERQRKLLQVFVPGHGCARGSMVARTDQRNSGWRGSQTLGR